MNAHPTMASIMLASITPIQSAYSPNILGEVVLEVRSVGLNEIDSCGVDITYLYPHSQSFKDFLVD